MTYQISLHSERGFAIHVYWHIYPVFVLICSLYGFLLCTLFLNNQVLYEVVKWVFKLIRWCSNFISTLISLYCNILIFTISMLTYVFFYQWRVVFIIDKWWDWSHSHSIIPTWCIFFSFNLDAFGFLYFLCGFHVNLPYFRRV